LRAAKKYQVTQVTKRASANNGLVTSPIKELKKGKMNFLVDSGATLTLMKVSAI